MSTRNMNGDTLEILVEGQVVLTLTERMAGETMEIAVAGEIRNEAAHDFEDELMAAFSVCRSVRLDLHGVTYLASLAMRALLSVQQLLDETGGTLTVVHLSEPVRAIFDEAGFLDILDVEE